MTWRWLLQPIPNLIFSLKHCTVASPDFNQSLAKIDSVFLLLAICIDAVCLP